MEELFLCVVFKWGSLVGVSLPTTGATGTPFRGAADVAFRPREFTGTITNWATVPYCTTDFANYGNTAADHLNQIHTPANIARGIGDICRHMGVVEGSRWRMPRAAEWAEFYGSAAENGGQSVVLGGGWIDGNYYPLSGRAMGAGQNYVSITYGAADTDAQVNNVNPWINGAVFLPACGNRHITIGAIFNIGSGGWYWSSTASAEDRGYDMRFDSLEVWPQEPSLRAHALSIRCIRE